MALGARGDARWLHLLGLVLLGILGGPRAHGSLAAAAYVGPGAPQRRAGSGAVPAAAVRRAGRAPVLVAAPAEPEEPEPEANRNLEWPGQLPGSDGGFSEAVMSALASRMRDVRESEDVQVKLARMPHAFVLVFDADTDEETIYSIELAEEDQHVVVAFEDRREAESYAATLGEEIVDGSEASVQALDLEALVVSSREADFRVGIVFEGDLKLGPGESTQGMLITAGGPSRQVNPLTIGLTMVPDQMYADRSTADLLDPNEDEVWVLVHDLGTGDASYFTVSVNGTDSIVCFQSEEASCKCCTALREKGAPVPEPRAMFLEEILDTLDIDADDLEVCLVDEVLEIFGEEGDASGVFVDDSALSGNTLESFSVADREPVATNSLETRSMLNRLLSTPPFEPEDFEPPAQGEGPAPGSK